ncbi:Restless-like transposase [Fusarium oxysporum f. sp. albedinis]|nr:Restless-like transposase [Fusarium oxysporum f. sp. albedinis]
MDSRLLGSYTGLAPYKCLVLMGYRKNDSMILRVKSVVTGIMFGLNTPMWLILVRSWLGRYGQLALTKNNQWKGQQRKR